MKTNGIITGGPYQGQNYVYVVPMRREDFPRWRAVFLVRESGSLGVVERDIPEKYLEYEQKVSQ